MIKRLLVTLSAIVVLGTFVTGLFYGQDRPMNQQDTKSQLAAIKKQNTQILKQVKATNRAIAELHIKAEMLK